MQKVLSLGLNVLANKVYEANKDKGFYEEIDTLRGVVEEHCPDMRKALESLITAQRLALITSETSETLESDRHDLTFVGKIIDIPQSAEEFKETLMSLNDEDFNKTFKERVKDSKEDEVADQFIRLLDFVGANQIDIDFHIQAKLRYNSLRAHKHGKSY